MTEYDLGKVVGDDGADGNGIASISKTGTSGLVDTYTITYDDGDSDTFTVTNGADGQTGATGNGIASVTKTGTSGLVDTYTILFTNGDSTTFTVTNGSDASVTIQTSWGNPTSDSKVASEKLTKTELDKKISTSSTTGLVKNDGTIDTSTYITSSALSGYQTTSNLVTSFSSTTSDSKYPSEKLIKTELDKKIATSSTTGLVKNDGSIDTSSYITSSAITGKEDTSNKVTSWSSTVNDTHYPSEKLVSDSLATKQATLVSGTNIKTINNESLLGSGNLVIQGGGGSGGSCVTDFYIDSNTDEWVIETTACSQGEVVTSWSSTLTDEKVPSEKLVKNYVDGLIGDAILYINGSGS